MRDQLHQMVSVPRWVGVANSLAFLELALALLVAMGAHHSSALLGDALIAALVVVTVSLVAVLVVGIAGPHTKKASTDISPIEG